MAPKIIEFIDAPVAPKDYSNGSATRGTDPGQEQGAPLQGQEVQQGSTFDDLEKIIEQLIASDQEGLKDKSDDVGNTPTPPGLGQTVLTVKESINIIVSGTPQGSGMIQRVVSIGKHLCVKDIKLGLMKQLKEKGFNIQEDEFRLA